MDPFIDRPRLGIAAFFDDSERGQWSMAAQLVGMILRLRSDDRPRRRGPTVLDELLVPQLVPINVTSAERLERAEWWISNYREWKVAPVSGGRH